MAEAFTVNGTTASLAPYRQVERDISIGIDHNGAPIYSSYKEIDLFFESASVTFAQQWMAMANGGSHTVDVLARNQIAYKTLSPIYIRINEYPPTESGLTGPFNLTIVKAT